MRADTVLIADFALLAAASACALAALLEGRRQRIRDEAARPRPMAGAGSRVRERVAGAAARAVSAAGVNLSASEALQIWALAAAVPPLAALAAGLPAAAVLAAIAAGAAVPPAVLYAKRQAADRRFEDALADVLPLVASGLRGGLSLRQALVPAADGMGQPIEGEFARLGADIDRGLPADQAVMNLAERTKSSDLRILSAAISAQRRTGGNLADVIDQVAETIRARNRARGEARSKTGEARLEAKILAVMPVALVAFLVATNETVRAYYATQQGHLVLALIALVMLAAVVWVNRLADIRID